MPLETKILPTADSVTDKVTAIAKKSRFAKLLELLSIGKETPKAVPLPYRGIPRPAPPLGLTPEVALALEPSLLAHGLNLKMGAAGDKTNPMSTNSMATANIGSAPQRATPAPGSGQASVLEQAKTSLTPEALDSLKGQGTSTPLPPLPSGVGGKKTLAVGAPDTKGPSSTLQTTPLTATGTGTGTMVNDVSETKMTNKNGSFDDFVMSKLGYFDPANANAMGMSLPGFLATGLSAYAGSQLGGGLDNLLSRQQAASQLSPVTEILTGGRSNPADDLIRRNHANSMLKELNLKEMGRIPEEAVGALRAAKLKDTLAKRLAKTRSPLLKSLGLLGGASLPFMISGASGSMYPNDPFMGMPMGMM